MDSFIVILVFLLLSAISTWIQKRREAQEAGEEWGSTEAPPGPDEEWQSSTPRSEGETTTSAPPRRSTDWETELKRLLGGEPEAPAPSQEAEPASRRSTAPAQPPPLVNREAPAQPSTTERQTPAPQPQGYSSKQEELAAAREKARGLKEQAAKKLKETGAPARSAVQRDYERGTAAADARIALSRIRNPNTVRQAFVASLIFGPPKGMEEGYLGKSEA